MSRQVCTAPSTAKGMPTTYCTARLERETWGRRSLRHEEQPRSCVVRCQPEEEEPTHDIVSLGLRVPSASAAELPASLLSHRSESEGSA
nr:hypothetical protein CFP56_75602 [Quercus suber]